jgi:hypothetical protein
MRFAFILWGPNIDAEEEDRRKTLWSLKMEKISIRLIPAITRRLLTFRVRKQNTGIAYNGGIDFIV